MASIRTRHRADGTTGYAVLWRHNGKQTSVTFDLLPAAESAKRLIEATGADPDKIAAAARAAARAEGRTVADAIERHITDLTGVAARTRADYRRDAAAHITPVLGALPAEELDRTAVAGWLNRLDDSALSDKTISNLHGLLSAAMTTAAHNGWARGNPCRGMRLPRRDHGEEEMVFLTHGEWALLRSELPEFWRPLFGFLVGTGARWGEAVGLTVGHLDLLADPPVARIVQADRRTPTGRELGPTKTRRSRRTVALPPYVVDALVPLATREPDARLFVSRRGGPLARSIYGQVWQPAVARARDPKRHGPAALAKAPRIHDLRHTHASWLIAAGVDLLAVSRRLGHRSITTTVDRYGHLTPDQETAAVLAAEHALALPG